MRNILIEIRNHSLPIGSKTMLFDEERLGQNWDSGAVELIRQSLADGKWKKVGKAEIRASRAQGDQAGWFVSTGV